MNIMIKFPLLFIIISTIFSNSQSIYDYKIKFFGINIANCKVIYSDTSIYDISAKKIQYKVTTNSLIDKIFKVNNNYTIILDKNNYNTLYYKKNTYQPKIINYIETDFSNGILKYKNSNITIRDQHKNIFAVLYMIHKNDIKALNNIEFVEREGKYYSFNYILENYNKIVINMNELDPNNMGLIKHTDIFSWGLFLDNTKKTIIYDHEKKYIEKCIFKKGITSITAKILK